MSPLADYKTMNYLYYFLAGNWAKNLHYDEALILNQDGSISETNSANILYIIEKNVIMPASPHVLPGVMQANVCALLKKKGYKITCKKLKLDDLTAKGSLLVTNSLMGAVPVCSIDGEKYIINEDLCEMINRQFFR